MTMSDRADVHTDARSLSVCLHESVHFHHWDHGHCRETGYHDAGAEFTCNYCGEVFTDTEFDCEMQRLADETNTFQTGVLLAAPLGITLEILNLTPDNIVVYRCRHTQTITGPLEQEPLALMIGHLRRGTLCRVDPTVKVC